jgi:hypothetical protein
VLGRDIESFSVLSARVDTQIGKDDGAAIASEMLGAGKADAARPPVTNATFLRQRYVDDFSERRPLAQALEPGLHVGE